MTPDVTDQVRVPRQVCAGVHARLLTRDGVELDVACAPGATVLESAAEAGFTLPSLCGTGTCGACHAVVREGEFTMGEHDPDALPQKGGRPVPGSVLLCRTHPVSDLRVDLPYERVHVIDGRVPTRRASVASIEPVADSTVRLRLHLEADSVLGAGLDFQPGQFVELEIPGTDVRRAYSLANTANWDGVAELLIRMRPGGAFSTWLAQTASVGDQLLVHGPQGAFGLRENGLGPRWFVGGGTGIAPLLAMVRRMAEWGDPQPVRVFLGVGQQSELLVVDDLREAGAGLSAFRLDVSVWQPGPDCTEVVGTPVDQLVPALAEGGPVPDVYICGPPAMVDGAAEALRGAGLSEEHLILERYLAC